ncbi:M43 family zinc metalloprotease [Actinomadura luteofluorescens]|uniref:M43 family zinc metalloprotease n=1 Tax=Actinomadura luteofluorescens TaxID=46163 RepID=UPI00363133AC
MGAGEGRSGRAGRRLRPRPRGHGGGTAAVGGRGAPGGTARSALARDRADLGHEQAAAMLADLRRTLLDRFGTSDEALLDQRLFDGPLAGSARRESQRRATGSLVVPVRFHVVHSGSSGRLSTAAVQRQIATLNAAYGGRLGGSDTHVRFRLDSLDRTDNPSWFHNPQRNEGPMKRRLRKGGRGTLNLYTAAVGSDVLGFSTFPQWYRRDPRLDGVIVDFRSLPYGSYAPFNHGFTAVHEIGHWLGLMHTFEGGCVSPGDGVADTPYEAERRRAARRDATRARSAAAIRSTISWTTPTTPACAASPQVRAAVSGRCGRRTGPARPAATVWISAQVRRARHDLSVRLGSLQ